MKTFVLDTNVVIHDPNAIFAFEGSRVVLPLPVIEELDTFKRSNDERGRAARLIARKLDGLRSRGKLSDGVPLDHGGQLTVQMLESGGLPATFLANSKDNQILGVAQSLKTKGENVVFISKDINLRIKAEAIGLETQDYEKEKVDVSDLYKGWQEVGAPGEEINSFYKSRKLSVNPGGLQPNEFVILRDNDGGSQSALARYDLKSAALVPLTKAELAPWGIKPLNTEQRFALELLLRKDVQLVTLVGMAGSGKTLLALAAGLQLTLDDKLYRRMLIARPVIPVGHDIGFLPGTKQE
ncbi:MAG: PhoH family protein, partial [Elusimicrobia bacterium]|nr:PhoH family protein [Elusimicrobiota bacterium]